MREKPDTPNQTDEDRCEDFRDRWTDLTLAETDWLELLIDDPEGVAMDYVLWKHAGEDPDLWTPRLESWLIEELVRRAEAFASGADDYDEERHRR